MHSILISYFNGFACTIEGFYFSLAGKTDDGGQNAVGSDGKPFTTLLYANGPGAFAVNGDSTRPNVTDTDTGS